jgi:hypothetical protein
MSVEPFGAVADSIAVEDNPLVGVGSIEGGLLFGFLGGVTAEFIGRVSLRLADETDGLMLSPF